MTEKMSDPIIETSLQEERDAIHRILFDCWRNGIPGTYNTDELVESLVSWGNSLIMRASDDEPGLVRLIPPKEKESRIIETPHQRIGSGPINEIIEPK